MHEITNRLIKDIKDYCSSKPKMTKDDWTYLKPYVDELKDFLTILAMMGEDLDGNMVSYNDDYSGYSMRRNYSGNNSYRQMNSRNGSSGNNSYRSSNRNGSSNRGYSRSMGDSKQIMLDNLYEAMDNADSEEERMSIQKCIDKLEY